MATLLQTFNLRYESANLKNRVTAAIAKAAQDILNESPATTNHTVRMAWANRSLIATQEEAERLMWGVLANSTIAAAGEASSDNDIQFVVNSLIDIYA